MKSKPTAHALKKVATQLQSVSTPSGVSAEVIDEQLVVRDGTGAIALVCTAVPGGGVRIALAEGNLTLAAPNGAIRLEANEGIQLVTPAAIRVEARDAKFDVQKWELRAGRIVEEAVEVYRVVDDILQTRAGRIRSLVKGAYQLFSHRTTMVSEDDTSVDGKRVLLG